MRRVLVALLAVGVWASPAMAGTRKVAVFPPVSTNPADQKAVDAMGRKLLGQLRTAPMPGVIVVVGDKLQRALGGKPAKVLAKCGGGSRCASQLGDRVGADEVLLINVTAAPGAVQLFMVDVKVGSAEIIRTVVGSLPSLKLPKNNDLVLKIREALGISGAPGASPDQAASAESDDMLSLPTSLDQPPPPPPAPPVVVAAPVKALPPPVIATRTSAPIVVSSPPKPWLITGLVSLGLGAAAAGAGAYFGLQYLGAPKQAPPGTTQLAYAEQLARANQAGQLATISLIGAGALGGIGAAALIVHAVRGKPSRTGVSFMPAPSGGGLVLFGAL